MSDIKEAVKSRYAGAAKQLAVIQAEPGAVGCCRGMDPIAVARGRTRRTSSRRSA